MAKHSKNSSAKADELFWVSDHFVGLVLKGLTIQNWWLATGKQLMRLFLSISLANMNIRTKQMYHG